jgi:hypothetical protein
MDESQNGKKPFSFKEFLDGNTSLLTVFAIFNALIVFSVGIKENELVRDVLTVSFWTFSLLTFLELSANTFKTYKEYRYEVSWSVRLKLSLFLIAVVYTQLALVVYFAMLYPFVVGLLVAFAVTVSAFLLLIWINVSIDEWIRKMKEVRSWSDGRIKILKKINNLSMFLVLILVGAAIIYFRYKSL